MVQGLLLILPKDGGGSVVDVVETVAVSLASRHAAWDLYNLGLWHPPKMQKRLATSGNHRFLYQNVDFFVFCGRWQSRGCQAVPGRISGLGFRDQAWRSLEGPWTPCRLLKLLDSGGFGKPSGAFSRPQNGQGRSGIFQIRRQNDLWSWLKLREKSL